MLVAENGIVSNVDCHEDVAYGCHRIGRRYVYGLYDSLEKTLYVVDSSKTAKGLNRSVGDRDPLKIKVSLDNAKSEMGEKCLPCPDGRRFSVGDMVDVGYDEPAEVIAVSDSFYYVEVKADYPIYRTVYWNNAYSLDNVDLPVAKDGCLVRIGYSESRLSRVIELISRGVDCSPSYRGGDEWDEEHKSRLIEDLFSGADIGPLVIAEIDRGDSRFGKFENETVDGGGRVGAIADFIGGKIKYRGHAWHELSRKTRKEFGDLKIVLGRYSKKASPSTDGDIASLFAKLNWNLGKSRESVRSIGWLCGLK